MSMIEKSSEFIKPKLTFGKELRFSPYAWAKLIYLRDIGDTEVAGYATTATDDPLLITDFRLIKQECTIATFDLDTNDIAEDAERTLDMGLSPWQTHNILCHTHPSANTDPSGVDEENFEKAFSHPNWAIMLIVGKDGSTYCRLKMNTGPGTISLLDVVIEYGVQFSGSNPTKWEKEYKAKVSQKESFHMTGAEGKGRRLFPDAPLLDVFEEELGATRAKITAKDRRYSEQAGSCNSSEWWNDHEAMWQTVSQEEKIQLEFEEMINEMDCWWDMDGDAIFCTTLKGEDVSYYYNPDSDTWQLDSGDDFQPCASPSDGGLDAKIKYWAKLNKWSRPEIGKATV